MAQEPVNRPTRYFSLHFRLFRFLGLGWWHHPDEGDTRNFFGWYLYYSIITQIVWVFGFVSLETIDPFVGEKDMERFMFNLSFVITHDLTLIKLCIFYFRNDQIQDIVRTIEIDLYQYYQNNEKNRRTVRITQILTGSFTFFGWMTILNTSVYGIVQDFQWKAALTNDSSIRSDRALPQSVYIPWDYQDNMRFMISFALQSIGLLWTGHIVLTIDTFIASLIVHMSSQFAILREALATVHDRTMALLCEGVRDTDVDISIGNSSIMNTEDDNERIVRAFYTEKEIETTLENTLVNCIRQHQVIIGCVEKFSRLYSYGFMTQLLSSMAAICVVMVQVSQDASSFKSFKLVTSMAFFFAMIIQLAIQCFTGSELTSQAERISDGVMDCKWERFPVRLQRLIVMIMIRAQRPLYLSAAGYAPIDNACFLSILKAAYSYYAVLSQTQA